MKSSILANIRANKPADRPLPELPVYAANQEEDLALFAEVLTASKTTVIKRGELKNYLDSTYAEAKIIVSTTEAISGNLDLSTIDDPLQLAGVDLAIMTAQLGVAENGAMWVAESEMVVRALPFITQHLVLVLDGPVLPTMHEAYQQIEVDATGFGCFIAGPSKTADIEQSLVIGAHGPRSLVVAL